MNNKNITLMELCETNCFSDSEEEDMSDSDKEEDIIKKQPLDTKDDTKDDAKNDIKNDTKDDTKNDKITIIVDSFYNEKTEGKYDDDWENIEFAELDDVINDPSSNLFTNKKNI